MFTNEFANYLSAQKRRDFRNIRRAEERLEASHMEEKRFQLKVVEAEAAMDYFATYYSEILKEYLDNPLVEFFFGVPFNQENVKRILKNKTFISFLVQANLVTRTVKLDAVDRGEVKLRLYLAILNFDEYESGK